MMKLSDESTRKLAETIANQVFDIVKTDGRYLDGVMNSIEPAVVEVIGKSSPELIAELSYIIMEMIDVPKFDVWKYRYETLYAYVKKTYAETYVDGIEYDIDFSPEGWNY